MTTPVTPPSADQFMGSSVKTASYDGAPPIAIEGEIVNDPFVRHAKDLETLEPKYWPNGDPVYELIVDVQTNLRDPSDPADDGVRRHYLGGYKKKAVELALKKAAVRGAPKRGGWLKLVYTADNLQEQKRGKRPPKMWEAEYRAPAPGQAEADQFWQQPESVQDHSGLRTVASAAPQVANTTGMTDAQLSALQPDAIKMLVDLKKLPESYLR